MAKKTEDPAAASTAAAPAPPTEGAVLATAGLIQGESLLSLEPTREQVLLAAALAALPHHLARTSERATAAAWQSAREFAAEWEKTRE